MNRLAQEIVDAQTDINRAVWATNLDSSEIPKMHCSFKDDAGRLQYINTCCKEAIKELQEYLKRTENLLF